MTNPLLEKTVTCYTDATECKLYCGSANNCCGCVKSSNITCQWIALTNCKRWINSNLGSEKCISEKPGNSIFKRLYLPF